MVDKSITVMSSNRPISRSSELPQKRFATCLLLAGNPRDMRSLCKPMPLIFIFDFLGSSFKEADLVLFYRPPQRPVTVHTMRRDKLTLGFGTKRFA
jgi:hypothetical protein